MNLELQWPTLGEWISLFLVLVGGSFIAGFAATWWEQRKRDKDKKGELWVNRLKNGIREKKRLS